MPVDSMPLGGRISSLKRIRRDLLIFGLALLIGGLIAAAFGASAIYKRYVGNARLEMLVHLAANGPESLEGLGNDDAEFIAVVKSNLGTRKMDAAYIDSLMAVLSAAEFTRCDEWGHGILVRERELFILAWNREVTADQIRAWKEPMLDALQRKAVLSFIGLAIAAVGAAFLSAGALVHAAIRREEMKRKARSVRGPVSRKW